VEGKSTSTPTPKVITGPIPENYADLPEEQRLAFAAGLASDLMEELETG
jgi:hypothetical protein